MTIKENKAINMLIRLQIICCLFEEIIYSYYPSMGMIFLIPEVLCSIYLILVIHSFYRHSFKIKLEKTNISCAVLMTFILYALLSVFWSNFNIYNIIVRFRYIFFGSVTYCVVKKYLSNDNFMWIINFMSIVQVINLFFTIYQNLIMRMHPDFCNGIFGFTGYSNAAQGCFCVALSILAFVYYIDGTWKSIKSFSIIGMSCVICAFAEIKVYFVVFLLAAVGIIAIRKNTLKEKLKIVFSGILIAILLYVAYRILLIVLPDNLYTFFSLQGYLKYEGRSDYAGRTNTIKFIYENLFHENFFRAMFGTGLGSTSSDYIYELGKSFSDFGFIGLGILSAFLVNIFLLYFNPKKNCVHTQERLFCAAYAGVFFIAIVVWNCTFTRFTYLNFFFLAISNVIWSKKKF